MTLMPETRRRYARAVVWAFCLAATVGNCVTAGVATRRVSCDFVCEGGGCAYSNCADGPSCPGGSCSFENCHGPSCRGGSCDFTSCHSPVCQGGSCRFFDPLSTLRDGYCDGGACKVNNKPFPSRFAGKLSI